MNNVNKRNDKLLWDSKLVSVLLKSVRTDLDHVVELDAFQSVAGTVLLVSIAAMQLVY